MSADASSPFEAVAAALRAGEVVLIPTDTVYGLAVDPRRPGATARLFAVKERPVDVALPVLAADAAQAYALAGEVSAACRRLTERFWPGPLTVVVERRLGLSLDLGGPDDRSIGLRVPDDPVVRRLAAEVGPLAVTSANRHGEPTPATVEEVLGQLGGVEGMVGAVLDDGPRSGVPSTVVDLRGGGPPLVLRVGAIPVERIAEEMD